MESYITRLCWNEREWKKPSGSAAKIEYKTFNTVYGFGFEEWLFSSSFDIDGWRYGFVQGVHKSGRRLAGNDVNLYFFTIDSERQRNYVGELKECHILTPDEADSAHKMMKRNGLIERMISDVLAVGGNPVYIKDESILPKGTLEIINICFRPRDLSIYTELIRVPKHSKIWGFQRYQLIKASNELLNEWLLHVKR